ncbi:protein kinase domain-containing protein, partial [Nocardioides stalactiti]|uniref:protein kinase domain-containing protein n=1 Tax=Nocardioides stalactiti TaxID=2755356 RepID=UPI001601E9DD
MQVLPSGDQLGRYRIDRVLDAGPDVVTYAADDPRLRRTVVLSVVGSGATGTADRTAELRAAATRLSGLSSPYVAQVHDHEVEGERVYVVSQYVPGGDLATWLTRHGPLPRHHALRIAEQVAAGLADAHRHGVTHDDLGPRHVLVRDPGTDRAHAWVADFPLLDADRGSVDGDLRGVGRVLLAALTGAGPG